MTPVSIIIAEIQKTLQDEVGYDYDEATELLPLLNRAASEICRLDPQANPISIPFQIEPFQVQIVNGGGGYATGDTITPAGGTGTAPTLVVLSNNNGAADLVGVKSYGAWTAYPSNPVSQASSSGSGTGFTCNILQTTPLQNLPPDAVNLIDITRNLGANGQTPGIAITKIPTDDMDACRPQWPTDICGQNGAPAVITHYVFRSNDPKRFYPWPFPASLPWWVEMIYNQVPNDAALTDTFPLPDLWIPATKSYVIAHALARRDKELGPMVWQLINYYTAEWQQQMGTTAPIIKGNVPRDQVNRQ